MSLGGMENALALDTEFDSDAWTVIARVAPGFGTAQVVACVAMEGSDAAVVDLDKLVAMAAKEGKNVKPVRINKQGNKMLWGSILTHFYSHIKADFSQMMERNRGGKRRSEAKRIDHCPQTFFSFLSSLVAMGFLKNAGTIKLVKDYAGSQGAVLPCAGPQASLDDSYDKLMVDRQQLEQVKRLRQEEQQRQLLEDQRRVQEGQQQQLEVQRRAQEVMLQAEAGKHQQGQAGDSLGGGVAEGLQYLEIFTSKSL